MSKHTPGPWTVSKAAHHAGMYRIEGASFGISLFTIATDVTAEQGRQKLSDAHKIAAAPEMLALLEELIHIEGPQPGNIEWFNRVKAAIAKAKGE